MKREKVGYIILTAIAIISVAGIFILSPIEQDKEYHNFCDSETIFNIPNFWNVVSTSSCRNRLSSCAIVGSDRR